MGVSLAKQYQSLEDFIVKYHIYSVYLLIFLMQLNDIYKISSGDISGFDG